MRRHRETPVNSRRQTDSISSVAGGTVSDGNIPGGENTGGGQPQNVFPLFGGANARDAEGPNRIRTYPREDPLQTTPAKEADEPPNHEGSTFEDKTPIQASQTDAQSSTAPAWVEHPITKALEALYSPQNGLNPAQVIADSLLPRPALRAPMDSGAFVKEQLPEEAPIQPVNEAPQEIPVEGRSDAAASQDQFWGVWLGHQEQLRRQCIRLMSGNMADAEDALSSAMLRASQKFPNYAGDITNEKAWLSKLVHNVCIDHYRQRKRTNYQAFEPEVVEKVDDAMFTGPQPSPEEVAVSREEVAALEGCVQQLSNNLRVPLLLRCVEGWSYPDIAEELDVRADTVRKRVQLARDFLRQRDIR